MTPEALADLHAAAFAPARGWTVNEFCGLCASPHVHLFAQEKGFALVRAVTGEAELLTLAVAPTERRKGIADALMRRWMREIAAETAFLEVAADNHAAQALYAKHGFTISGRRPGYYKGRDGAAVDAVLMQAALPPGQSGESPLRGTKTG